MPTFALSSGAIVEISELLYDFLEYEAVKGTRWTAAQLVMILGELIEEINAFLNQHIAQWENDLSFGQLTSFSVNQDPAGQYVLVGHTSTGRDDK